MVADLSLSTILGNLHHHRHATLHPQSTLFYQPLSAPSPPFLQLVFGLMYSVHYTSVAP